VVVVELDGSESEALDLVALVTSAVLEEHHLVVGVVVVVDPGVVPINSRGEKQRMHLRDGFLADQLDPIYVAYNMWTNVQEKVLTPFVFRPPPPHRRFLSNVPRVQWNSIRSTYDDRMSDLCENLANKNILFSFIFFFYFILGFLKRILNYLDRVYINSTLEFLRIRSLVL